MVRLLLGFVLGLFVPTPEPLAPEIAQSEPVRQGSLELGVAKHHVSFEPGTSHVWDVPLGAGRFTEIQVVQNGVDVVLVIVDPEGTSQGESDMPLGSGAYGSERIVWIPAVGGTWSVEVRPWNPAPAGEYTIELLERAASDTDVDLVEAQAATIEAVRHHEQQRFEEAEAAYQRTLAIHEEVHGPEDPRVATSLLLLASFREKTLNQSDEAKKLYTRALTIQNQALPSGHPDVTLAARSLAALHRNEGARKEKSGLYKEATASYERAYTLDMTHLGPDHPDLAVDFSHLARLYRTQSRFAEAEPLYQRAREIFEKPGYERHLGATLNNLGALKRDQGKYGEAEALFREALELLENALGSDHPDVAASLNNVAAALRPQGKHEEAGVFYLRSLVLRRKTLGPEHLDVAGSLNNLAVLYREQGQYDAAEQYYRQALEIQEKELGREHPLLARTLYNLARTQHAKGDPSAVDSSDRAIELLEQTTGFRALRVHAYALRAQIAYESRNLPEALEYLEVALHAVEEIRPHIGGGEETRADFFERFSTYYDRMVSWQIEAKQLDQGARRREHRLRSGAS